MPCSDPRSDEIGHHCCTHAYRDLEMRERLNTATRLLCDLLRKLDKRALPIPATHKEWWAAHKKLDELQGRH